LADEREAPPLRGRHAPVHRRRGFDEASERARSGGLRGCPRRAPARAAPGLLGVFVGFVERIGAILTPGEKEELDAAIAQAREALGNEAFDAAWAAGGGLSLDQAVELSLTVTASPAVGPDPT
jgi:hypothetical protein